MVRLHPDPPMPSGLTNKMENIQNNPQQQLLASPQPSEQTSSKKPPMLSVILIGIIIFIIISSLAYMLFIRSSKQSSNQVSKIAIKPTSTATPFLTTSVSISPTSVPGWKIYQNALYGFTLNYPDTFSLYEKPGQVQTFIPQCNDTSLVSCLFLSPTVNKYPNFAGASIEINVSKKDEVTSADIKNETDCKAYFTARLTDPNSATTKQINGIVFYYGTFGQGATGHIISEQHFETYLNNTCFYVKLNVAYDDVNPPFFTQESLVFALLNQILATFKFTN